MHKELEMWVGAFFLFLGFDGGELKSFGLGREKKRAQTRRAGSALMGGGNVSVAARALASWHSTESHEKRLSLLPPRQTMWARTAVSVGLYTRI